MEDIYLKHIINTYQISGKSTESFIKTFLNKLCNTITVNSNDYLKRFSKFQNEIHTLLRVAYYVIENSNDTNKIKQWNKIIEAIENFNTRLKNVQDIKNIIRKQNPQGPNEQSYYSELVEYFGIEKKNQNENINKLKNIINNNKNKLEEFKQSDTLVKLNKGIVEDLNRLNARVCCIDSNGETIFSNEIKSNYQTYHLLVNLDNIEFFTKYLKPKYSQYILSILYSANREYCLNYLYYHINNLSYLVKTKTYVSEPHVVWIKSIMNIGKTFQNEFGEYINKVVDYCNVQDKELTYETFEYRLNEMMSITDLIIDSNCYETNKRIMRLLCSAFDIGLTTKYDRIKNIEYYNIKTNRVVNGQTNTNYTLMIKYNNSIEPDYVFIEPIKQIILTIPKCYTTNNSYTNKIIPSFDKFIYAFSDCLFDTISPNDYFVQNTSNKTFQLTFDRFCYMICYDNIGFIFTKKGREELLLKRYLSTHKAYEYLTTIMNLIFESTLLNQEYMDGVLTKIKTISSSIKSESIRTENIIEILPSRFKEIYSCYFNYCDKMQLFNPLFSLNNDYLTNMKVDVYACSIYNAFKNHLNIKKKKNIECSSVYEIMDIDNFNNYLLKAKTKLTVDNILDIFFNIGTIKNEDVSEDEELMTETAYDISKVITKEDF